MAKTLHLLSDHLPALGAAEARLARIASDRRLPRWINAILRTTDAKVVHTERGAGIFISLSCRHGRLELSCDAAAWPALEMAVQLPSKPLAREVVEAALASPLAVLEPWLPDLTVHDFGIRPEGGMHHELRCGSLRIGLQAVDEGVANHLAAAWREAVDMDAWHIRRLQLPMRIGLFERELSFDDLCSLEPGDIVVAGGSHSASRLLRSKVSFGIGVIMQANAVVDLDASNATLNARPLVGEDVRESARPDLRSVGDLSVPVAFEIDSARVSLDELAAFDAGSVIELDSPVRDAPVRLVCYGQVVGVGRLVVVGDCLGVRIERIGMRTAGAAGG